MSNTHQTVKTAHPRKRALEVTCSEEIMFDLGGVLPLPGTKYSDAAWKSIISNDYLKNFGEYLFIDQLANPRGGGAALLFGPPNDGSQDIPFRTVTSSVNHYWHPVLLAIDIIPDFNTPRTYKFASGQAVSGPSFFSREEFIPAATEGTRKVEEFFYSSTPFVIPQHPCPQPGSVSYDIPGNRGGFPECLHAGITIPDLTTASSIQVLGTGGGQQSAPLGSGVIGQFFPPTNFKKRAPYITQDEQSFESGYVRRRVTVYPPPVAKLTIK